MRLDPTVGDRTFTLAYPAASRRLGGLAAGVDLTPDHGCSYGCIYCDVEGIADIKPADIDVELLGEELDALLAHLTGGGGHPDAPGATGCSGILISGTGEPTMSFVFQKAVERVLAARSASAADARIALVTNGTHVPDRKVRGGIEALAAAGGEIWLKLDTATKKGMGEVHGSNLILRQVRENMRVASNLCPTFLQTTLFLRDGAAPDESEKREYLSFLNLQKKARVPFKGVQLLNLDRATARPGGANALSACPAELLEEWAAAIGQLDIPVETFV